MVIVITIDGVDRTENIVLDSINKQDNIHEQVDSLNFNILKYGSYSYEPEINKEVIMTIDGVRVFGGVIVSVEKSIKDGNIVMYRVKCSDYIQYLNRQIVVEKYENKTVDYIISDLITNYTTDGFTTNNVNCEKTIITVSFDRLNVSECLKKLADLVGYSWYVDYNKDVHFFGKSGESASFGITDSNGNYIQNSLSLNEGIDQIRNSVLIRGGEAEGNYRTETYVGENNQLTFPLGSKFASLPAVTVNGATQTVGVDFLTEEDDADCFWDYNQKYIRFKINMKDSAVVVAGIPLYPIIVKTGDSISINDFGLYEFTKEDKSIKSRDEAIDMALAELNAYSSGIVEGSFSTDQSGLRSGQTININSTLLDTDEDFIIQRVNFKMITKDKGQWDITLATAKTMGIVSFLQELLRKKEIKENEIESLLNFFQFDDPASITDSIGTPSTSSPPYVWYSGTETNYIRWNLFTWT